MSNQSQVVALDIPMGDNSATLGEITGPGRKGATDSQASKESPKMEWDE